MTSVGHTLTGLALASATVPPERSFRWRATWFAIICNAANLPDFPIPGWGHGSYPRSHSLIVALAFTVLISAFFGPPLIRSGRATRGVILAASLAWWSHMPLDALYAHGAGLAVLWPLSELRLAWPVPWFETLSWPPLSEHNRSVVLTELLCFAPLTLLGLLIRHRRRGALSPDPKTALRPSSGRPTPEA